MTTTKPSPIAIQVGIPLPYSLYDENNRLLLAEGGVVTSERTRDRLLTMAVRTERATPAPARMPVSVTATHLPTGFQLSGEPANAPSFKGPVEQCTLLLNVQGAVERFAVPFIGSELSSGLIVGQPRRDAELVKVPVGTRIAVDLFAGKAAYAFLSTPIFSTPAPLNQLHLAWPKRVYRQAVRRHPRAPSQHPATFRSSASLMTELPARLVNISTNGALVEVNATSPAPGQVLELLLDIQVAGIKRTLCLLSAVRHRSNAPNPQAAQLGLEFLGLGTEEQLALSMFVNEALSS